MSSVLHRTHVCQWTLHRRAGRRSRLPERSSSGMQAGTVRLHKIINRIIICINPHKIAYLYLNLPLRTIYGIFFEPYAGGIYTLQIRSGRSAAPILCQLFKIIVMNNRKLLIFASFLLLAGCTTDPDMDNNVGGGTSAQTPSAIIGKTKCDGIQNQMRLFGGRVSPKRKATKISHTHTKKHRSNGF